MRPEAIRRAARDEVYRVLWTLPDHGLVDSVRKEILAKDGELAKQLSNGTLLREDDLGKFLRQLDREGARRLAAVLWASKFEAPEADVLFRMLVPLAQDGPGTSAERPAAQTHELQLRELRVELRTTKDELNRERQNARKAQEQLRNKESALARAKQELKDPQKRYQAVVDERDALQNQLRETRAALADLQRDAEKASRTNDGLRRDLRRLQNDLRSLGVERSELARKLADQARHIRHLSLELDSLPRGVDAAWAFMREEKNRIQTDRRILSGGDKARADAEWAAHRKLKRAFLEAYPQYRPPRPVKIARKSPLRFIALGGSDEVGRSCYLLELDQYRILVDCGVKPSESEDLQPRIDRLDEINALVLTHAHTDHIGWVPASVRRFGDIDIYCSEGTAALLPVVLEDCRDHYVRKMNALREREKYRHSPTIIRDEYDEKDIESVTELAITCEFGERVPFGDVTIQLMPAGHILGAASILIEDSSGRRIFFSGDFSSFPQLTVPAATWPDDLDDVDLLVLESTYGDSPPHPPLAESRQILLRCIKDTLEGRGGSVIIASFAVGRAQELLKLIVAAQLNGELPASIPIYVDGMIRWINPIYSRLADFDIGPDAYYEVFGRTEREEIAALAQRDPSIIVTTSGMLQGGPVVEYARRLVPDPRHQLVLTGYQDEGAPGRALLESMLPGHTYTLRVRDEEGELVEVKLGRPAKGVKLSAHADQPGLLEYAQRLRPRNIALVHGEGGAQEQLRSALLKVLPDARITCGPSELTVA
jgi:Cft2 family RNA processing exonuclease